MVGWWAELVAAETKLPFWSREPGRQAEDGVEVTQFVEVRAQPAEVVLATLSRRGHFHRDLEDPVLCVASGQRAS